MATLWETRGKKRQNSLEIKDSSQKKVLSLVLCVAVMLSVMVLGAGAAFSDQDQIENTEAVNMCSALNIIGGYEDGTFHPERNIKRSEVTKMICVALNGGTEPNVSTNAVPTFSDVRGTSAEWAEGYIEACVAQGIVSGVGGGRFSPDGNVTGAQLAKMLLVSLGYNADNEKFVGDTWETNVNVRASQKGLYKGLEAMDTSVAVTRDAAAQMVWNALQANMVEYKTTIVTDENGQLTTQITVQDRVVNDQNDKLTLLADKYDGAVETGFITAAPSSKTNPKGITFVWDRNSNGTYGGTDENETVTFRNATTDVSDLLGYEVTLVWNTNDINASDAIYGFYKTDDNTSYEAVWKDIEADGNKVKFGGKSYKLDGNQITVFADEDWTTPFTWTSNNFNKDALSDTVVFIDNDGDGDLDAAQVKTQAVTQVTYVGSKNVTTKALVGNQDLYTFAYDTTADLSDVNVYEGIAKDDYVKVSYDYYTDKVTYEKLDVQTGTIEATRTNNTTKEVKIGGEWLKATQGYTGVDTLSAATGDTVEYVAIGNLIYNIKKTDGQWGSNSIAMVYNAAKGAAGTLDADKVMAEIIKRDGSTATVEVSKVDNADVNGTLATVTAIAGKIVTYRVVDGKYEFRTLDDANNTAGFEHALTNDAGGAYAGAPASKYDGIEIADDAIVFVIHEGGAASGYADADNSADVLTGSELKKARGVTFEEVYATQDMYLTNTKNGFNYVYGMVVGIDTDTLITTGSNYGYLLADAAETTVDGKNYRVFNMWTEAGEITAYEETGYEFEYESGTVITYEVTSVKDGITYIKSVDVPDLTIGQVTAKDGNNVGLDGTKYELVNDSVVLNVDTDAGTGISGGDEARGQIAEADLDAGVLNVLYDVDANDEIIFMLIDTVNNEILNFDLSNVTASALKAALAGAEAGDTLTLTGNIPDGTFNVPEDVTVTIAGTISDTTVFNVADGAAVKVSATATGLAGKLTANVAAGGAVELPQGKLMGDSTALTSYTGTDAATVAANAGGGVDITVPSTSTLTLNQNFEMSAKDNLTVAGKLIAAKNGITFTTDAVALPTGAGVSATTGNFYANGDNATSDAIATSKTYTYGTHTVTGGAVTGWMAS